MRMTELAGKEIVNIYDGARMGVVGESDLAFDADSGKIETIIIPRRNNPISFWFDRQHMIIPWEAVRKVGAEVIIVDIDQANPNFSRYPV